MRSLFCLLLLILLVCGVCIFSARSEDQMAFGDAQTAASHGNVVVLQKYIDGGGNPNARGEDGSTLLVAAVVSRQHEAVAALIDLGADPNEPTECGFTPLMFAAGSGDAEVVDLLLAAGARPSDHSLGHKTALDIARDLDRVEVAALLESVSATNADDLTGRPLRESAPAVRP